MKTLLLAAMASATFVLPALAQNQPQPRPAPAMPQIEPNDHAAQPIPPPQAGASMQAVDPNTLSRSQVQQIQQALDKNGFRAGQADGRWGPATRSALVKFQKSKNMGAANGQLDDATIAALQLNPGAFGQGPGGAAPTTRNP